MRYATLIAKFITTPWALELGQLQVLSRIVGRWAQGFPAASEDLEEAGTIRAARDSRRQANNVIAGGVATIPIYGLIVPRADMFSEMSGATSAQRVSADLSAALADEAVASILLDIDSPGGDVMGMTELAAEIYAANAKKPVTAIANGLAASAAYWLGSQAGNFRATPSALVGSIGVYSVHENWAEAAKAAGVETTFISAGKFKTEGNQLSPLSPEAKDHMQSLVDSYYAAFTRDVARGRKAPVADVRNGMGQGRVLSATDAKAAGMIDEVSTYAETVKAMQRAPKVSRVAQAERELAILNA